MPPRPLYRWKSFWLGVFFVVFLGWAWWDSSTWESQANFFRSSLQVVHARGEVWVLWHDGFLGKEWSYFYGERNFQKPGEWDSWEAWEVAREYGFKILKIAHWFLILLFLLPWTTWLFWRSRRMKRLAFSPGTAGPQTGSSGP